jgi:Lrp/AsnC family transcriptional regulator for asnA, asnC and gidA
MGQNRMKNKIISELREDSRRTLTGISEKTKIPITTLYSNIKKLEKDNIIKRYTALVNFSKLGYSSAAFIAIKIDRDDRERFKEFIRSNDSVNSAYEIDTGYDFLIETIHKDQTELKLFLEQITGSFKITEKRIYLIINTIKKEEFKPGGQ